MIEWDSSEKLVEFMDSCLERGGELVGQSICKFTNPNPDPNILLLGKLAEIGIYVLSVYLFLFCIYSVLKLYKHARKCSHCKGNIATTFKDDCWIGEENNKWF